MESAPLLAANGEPSGGDKAGRRFWDQLWEKVPLPSPLDPLRPGLDNYLWREFHRYFEKVFKGHPTRGKKLMEIGCAQSVFLPYFSKYFGFEISGLDRSSIGCEKARRILEREEVSGEIYCVDFLSPPQHLFQDFDVVVSFGVVEHFENTTQCLRAISKFLKPEGRIITVIPNLAGILGTLQKVLDRAVYDMHVPLDRQTLAAAHQEAGLALEGCEYFLVANFRVLNIESWPKGVAYKAVSRLLRGISKAFWLGEDFLPFLKPNRRTSPYVNCLAKKVCG